MKIEGAYTFAAPRETVWAMFLDADRLNQAMPGETRLEQIRVTNFKGEMRLQIGPLKGDYYGVVTLQDMRPPESYHLLLDGHGPEGAIQGEGQLWLEENEERTTLHYAGDVRANGRIAAESPRLLRTSAHAMIRQCLEALDRQLQNQLAIHTTSLPAPQAAAPRSLHARLPHPTPPEMLRRLNLQQQAMALMVGWLLTLTGGLFVLRILYNWWLGRVTRRVMAQLAQE